MPSMQLPCLGGGSRIRFRGQRLFEQIPFCRAARTWKLRDPFSEHHSREAPHVAGGQMMFGVWFIFSFNTWNAKGPQGHEKREGRG